MNPTFFFSAVLLSSLLFSCEQAAKKEQALDTLLAKIELKEPSLQDGHNEKQTIPVGIVKQNPGDSISAQPFLQTTAHMDWDKKIIKTATVKLEVKVFKKYNETIHKIIRQLGGYIAQEQQNFDYDQSSTTLSIKIPVEQFETMMNELPAADTKVMERMITSQDVSGEVIDTRLRIEAKRQVRLKYLDFLKASKNMGEALKVQNEINGIQEEIEAATGRVEYLSHQSAYSTVNLTFYQPVNGFKPIDTNPSFLTRVSSAFILGSKWIADLMIALISIWPLLLVAMGGLIVFKRMKYFKTNPRKS